MESGIELIRKEREEQIEKHNRTVDLDIKINDEYQLPFAASVLSHPFLLKSEMISSIPKGWNLTIWTKMCSKTRKERYIIAGALIAAELDRLINQA